MHEARHLSAARAMTVVTVQSLAKARGAVRLLMRQRQCAHVQAAFDEVLDGGEFPFIRLHVRKYCIRLSIKHELLRISRNFSCVLCAMMMRLPGARVLLSLVPARLVRAWQPDFKVGGTADLDVCARSVH